MTQLIRTEEQDGILIITIDRPDVRNAINYTCAEQMAKVMDRLDEDPSLKLGILTGAGSVFSAGMDLKDFAQTGKRARVEGRGFAGLTDQPPTKPLIAAIEGYALAGGFEIALSCDLIVASNTAKLGLPEVKRGLVAGAGGMLRLPRRLPYHIAMELILTGEHFPATRAAELGLVNVLCEPGEALQSALDLAKRIVCNGPLAVQMAKRIVNEGLDWSQAEMFERQAPLVASVLASEDAREGALAFTEKRAPQWKGR